MKAASFDSEKKQQVYIKYFASIVSCYKMVDISFILQVPYGKYSICMWHSSANQKMAIIQEVRYTSVIQ